MWKAFPIKASDWDPETIMIVEGVAAIVMHLLSWLFLILRWNIERG